MRRPRERRWRRDRRAARGIPLAALDFRSLILGRRYRLSSAQIAVVVIGVGCLFLHLLWLHRFRWGYPTEWDEAGYIAIGVRDTHALLDGGPVSMLRMVEGQPVQAPLVPLAIVPFHVLFGTGVDASLLVVPVFFAVLVAATYGIARTILAPWWAALAVLVVATAPVVTDYTRLLHFSVPAAAMMATAVWALLRSEQLCNRRFTVAAGAFVGMMLLARTMTLSYLPGIALAAAAQLAAPGGERRRRALNLGLGALTAVVVAGTWYGHNWPGVYHYLVGSGYGSASNRYGAHESPFSPAAVGAEFETLVRELYLPLIVALAAALLIGGAYALVRLAHARGRPRARSLLSAPELSLFVIVLAGYLALSSSRNDGTAFGLPLLALLVVLVVVAVARIPARAVRLALAVALSAVSMGDLAMKSGFGVGLAGPRTTDLLGMTAVPVVDGRGIIQDEAAATGYVVSATRPLPAFHRGWLGFERRLVRRISDRAHQFHTAPTGYLGARHFLLTNTSLRLAAVLERRELIIGWLDAAPDSEQTYARDLRNLNARFLVVAESPKSAEPGVTLSKAEDAARSLGYHLVDTMGLPDGRAARLWWLRR